MELEECSDNWTALRWFLPSGWEEEAKKLEALRRQRNLKCAGDLLRVLLIHLADGCSLRETVVRASQAGLARLSDVALLKRLRASSEWLRWMAVELLAERKCAAPKPEWLTRYNLRSVDATVVCEPGSTGTDWRLHYSLEVFNLYCDHFRVTRQDVGESFTNFPVAPGDILIGDRVYGTLSGMWHVKNHRGDFIVRLRSKAFRLHLVTTGEEFDLLKVVKTLNVGQVGEWKVEARGPEHKPMRVRICAVKKSEVAAEEAIRRALRRAKERGQTVDPGTLELHRYVILATSIEREKMRAEQIAELYRIRWQIEIAFKRLKSIMGLGHLPKSEIESARAWLHGKVFVALLVQAMVDEGRSFSPWGYPLGRIGVGRELVA